uniref:Uncharacterized protein n=1 Tax=Tanacetum cinerariifolium TaxID=118510 RepID=A0A6L2N243_TANCI|nr:hypothetical protein [Tanacetum cinerariifolium]
MKLNWDGSHMRLLAPMLVVSAGGDGADAAAAGATAANEVPSSPPPPDVPPTHTSSSTPGPSTAAKDTPVRDPTPVREPTPSPVREATTFREPTPEPPRPPSPSPHSPLPCPTRQTSFLEDISEGGGDYVSSPKSNEALPTTDATAAGGVEDSVELTDLSLKLDKCINRGKKVRGNTESKKEEMLLSDSEGEEAAIKEQEIDLDALYELASTSLGGDTTVEAAFTIFKASQDAHASSDVGHDTDEVPDTTTMPFRRTRTKRRRLKKTFTSSAFKHFQEYIFAVEDTFPAGAGIPVDAQTIPAGTADKGKAPMVDDSILADLLTEQEWVLKNLHDYQLEEDLAKKLQAEQEAKFVRQQEELAQKAQAESVALPAAQGTGLLAQCRCELDAAQLMYTEVDWLELMAKIATNSALSKQLSGDDVNEENMNERLATQSGSSRAFATLLGSS